MKSIEQFKVGEIAELEHTVTQDDVETFMRLTGDRNPLHVDEQFARRTSLQKPVVHGMLSSAFISTLIGMVLPGPGALWTSQTLEFLHPTYIGDTLKISGQVAQISPATRTLLLDIQLTNQRAQRVVTGRATVKLLELIEEKNVTELPSQVVLVTGANRGIGAAIARRLEELYSRLIAARHPTRGAA